MNVSEVRNKVATSSCHSAWSRAVKEDALFLCDNLIEWKGEDFEIIPNQELHLLLLNGVNTWTEYSWGGSALCYNYDIARHYMTQGEFKKWQDGKLYGLEPLLDIQARALYQAERLLFRCSK